MDLPGKKTPSPSQDLLDELKPIPTFSVFHIFRFLGMGFILLSTIFLFQKHKDPIITYKDYAIRNGQLGNLLLTVGGCLFFVYLLFRIYKLFKTN